MVWKINKYKKSDRPGRLIKQKQVLECQPKLKSCLKTRNGQVTRNNFLNEPAKSHGHINNNKVREVSSKSNGSRGGRSWNSNSSADVKSKGSGNSSLSFTNRKRVASVDQHSESSRSWDHESRKSETAQSIQASERSSTDSRSQVKEKKKKVHFTFIHIRDYERVVGDNPSCTIGPPVGIGWNYGETRVVDVDSFESTRTYQKSASYLILSREEREALLLNWGASFHDIIESVRGNLKIKNQRRQTVTNLGKIERIEEAFESATRKLKSALMLRRSTGNKVKRLQEQASLAQSALTSLKIAEDRALSEIRGNSCVEIVEEPKSQENFNSFPVPQYGPPSTEENDVIRPHMIIPEEDDQPSRRYSLTGNSTTQSELEIERFYRELELEMFGDEELPSMVGQTLEVPLDYVDENHVKNSIGFRLDESSVNSSMTDKHSRYDLDDELLEKERNRSMISQNLLEETDNEFVAFRYSQEGQGRQDSNHSYFPSHPARPLHMNQMTQQNLSELNRSTSFVHEALMPMGYKEPYHNQQQTIPLHAGMTMFEDCALLGGQNDKIFSRDTRRRSSRKKDRNAGPKVQFIPPPTHLTPTQWMDDPDPNIIPSRVHETITISEDDFCERSTIYERGFHAYKNSVLPSTLY